MNNECVCVLQCERWSASHYVPIEKNHGLQEEKLHLLSLSSFVPLFDTHHAAVLKAH